MRNVLFLLGIEDSNRVTIRSLQPRISYEMQGIIDIYWDLRHPELRKKVITLGGADARVPAVERPDIIFNCITDADGNSKALQLAMQVIRQHPGVTVINRPVHVLKTRRDDVAAALADIPGVVAPATVRIRPTSHREILDALEQGPVRYPAIIRTIGTHGGKDMWLLRSREDAPLLEQLACNGSEYYLISFVDFRDDDGLYRKTRLVVVGDRVFARHQLASRDWNVHASARSGVMAEREELRRAEAEFLKTFGSVAFPPLAERLGAIQQRLKLDYFTIDCSLRPNGDLLIFEANASGNALRQADLDKFPYLRQPVRQLRAAVLQSLLKLPPVQPRPEVKPQ